MDLTPREPGDLRASDGERRRVVATLQAACVEGRLNLDEYGQRVEDALAARTRAQLEALLGSRDMRVGAAPPEGAPIIRITGMVLLGSLNVRDAAQQAHIDAYS